MAKSLTELRAQLSDIEPSDATFMDIASAEVATMLAGGLTRPLSAAGVVFPETARSQSTSPWVMLADITLG